jgi:catechol 2,3-dioxygenase-like lactoylglutathione lyase family enzyme
MKTLHHVTLVVSDFDASKKFYIEQPGLKQIDAPWLPDRN